MLLSNTSSMISRKDKDMVLRENESLPKENNILSFHAELPAVIPTLDGPASSSSSNSSIRSKEAEDFLQLLKRKKESNLNNLIIQQTQVSLDQFNLSLGEKSPLLLPQTRHSEEEASSNGNGGVGGRMRDSIGVGDHHHHHGHGHPLNTLALGTIHTVDGDGMFGDMSTHTGLPKRSDHSDDNNIYTMHVDMGVQVVEQIMCIYRGNKVEDFDVKGGLRLSTLNATSDREGMA